MTCLHPHYSLNLIHTAQVMVPSSVPRALHLCWIRSEIGKALTISSQGFLFGCEGWI